MVDDLGGWGQPAADLLAELRDDYAGSPVLLWATRRSAACPAAATDVRLGGRRLPALGAPKVSAQAQHKGI